MVELLVRDRRQELNRRATKLRARHQKGFHHQDFQWQASVSQEQPVVQPELGEVEILPNGSQRVLGLPQPKALGSSVLLTAARARLDELAGLADTIPSNVRERVPLRIALDEKAVFVAPAMVRLRLPVIVVVRSAPMADALLTLGVQPTTILGIVDEQNPTDAYTRLNSEIETVSMDELHSYGDNVATYLNATRGLGTVSDIATTLQMVQQFLQQHYGFALPEMEQTQAVFNYAVSAVDAYLQSQG